jgi:hypothetical protein
MACCNCDPQASLCVKKHVVRAPNGVIVNRVEQELGPTVEVKPVEIAVARVVDDQRVVVVKRHGRRRVVWDLPDSPLSPVRRDSGDVSLVGGGKDGAVAEREHVLGTGQIVPDPAQFLRHQREFGDLDH